VESFRTETGSVRQRVIANFGRLDKLEPRDLDPLINGLNRALGRAENPAQPVEYQMARAFGDVYALHELWQSLGFGPAIKRALRSSRRSFDAEALVRAMVFNRLYAPDSKLGCLEWLETVTIPAMPIGVTHDQLLRTMDALMDRVEAVEACFAKQLRPMIDRHLSVVFYDLTTVRIHGEGQEVPGDIRAFKRTKETSGIARQFVLGVVQSADGLPLMHTVHAGNMAETKTLQSMVNQVLARFAVERVILVADRGLLSLDNVTELSRFIHADYPADRFSYSIDEKAIERAERSDGKLVLLTSIKDLSAEEVLTRYKNLADIERRFRVLKRDLEIAPVYHRLPDRIRTGAHAIICFLALVLYRVMRMRLKAHGSTVSPKTALELLGRIQQHRATIGGHTYTGINKTAPEQLDPFDSQGIPRP
jgi:Transposase DDE domain